VVVDENSKLYVRDDWHLNRQSLISLREECVKTGASVGYYLLEDLLAGCVPKCRAYVFANAYRLTAEQVTKIHARVKGATAIWIYAPGWLAPGRAGAAGVAKTAGIAVTADAGTLGSTGHGPLAHESWGRSFEVTPRISVTDRSVEVLGRYAAGGGVSAARKKLRGFDSVLICDWFATRDVLRALFENAGCHVWTRDAAVVRSDGRLLLVHAAAEGTVSLRMPPGVTARPLDAALTVRTEGRDVRLECRKGTTALFSLSR
jgi:hypothetical protein